MRQVFAILMLCGFLHVSPAQAQEEIAATSAPNLLPSLAPEPVPSGPLPDAALGIWSAPDCTDAQSVLVLSRYYQMHVRRSRHSMTDISQWRSEEYDGENLFFYLTGDDRGFFFKMTNDGLFRHLMHFVHPKQDLHTAWDSIIERMSDEYTRCAKLFTGTPVVTQEEVNLPFLLDRVREPCLGVEPDGFARAGSCHAALFATLDANDSKMLDAPELSALYRQSSFLENSVGASCRLSVSGMTPTEEKIRDDAENFAAEALRLGDKNGDRALTLEETTGLATNPLFYALREPLLQKLRSARFAFSFLPLSNAERSCSEGSSGGQRNVYTGVIILEQPAPGPGLGTGGGCGCGG